MSKVILILLSLSLLAPPLAMGQNLEKLERKALKAFYAERLDEASLLFKDILNADPRNKSAAYRQLICQILTEERSIPIDKLLQYRSTQGRKDKFYNYWLGRVYYQQNNFQKARESWSKFLSLKSYKSKEITQETEAFIQSAILAEAFYSHPENYEIDQLPEQINTDATEYSPVYFKEKKELLYLSGKNSEIDEEEFTVYHSILDNGKWSRSAPLEQFGRFLAKNANIEVVNDSKKLYLYKEFKKGAIYSSTKNGNKWMAPKIFDEISSGKLESHFFINEQETRLLFAHRSKGKNPDLNIYETVKDPNSGKWSNPQLFSDNISSRADEDFPYLTADGRSLYFCSKGFGSIGGYDVFRSDFSDETGTWSQPISLRYPTNSIDDDIQFKIDESTNSGYFVSNRYGSKGSFDIYFFHESAKVLVTGMVLDRDGNPADFTEIHFYPSRTTGLELKTMTNDLGMYKVKLGNNENIRVSILYNDSTVLDDTLVTPPYQGKDISMTKNFKVLVEKKVLIEPEVVDDPTFADLESIGSKFRLSDRAKLTNLYFDFGEYKLDHEDKANLAPLLTAMRENPKLRIEIAGHTDNIGNANGNLRLSLLRAQSVAKFLFENKIVADRAVAKGYGQTKPLASNDQEREGRELNRRIEIVVIE